MGSKPVFAALWLAVTALAAFLAWRSLDFVASGTEHDPAFAGVAGVDSSPVSPPPTDAVASESSAIASTSTSTASNSALDGSASDQTTSASPTATTTSTVAVQDPDVIKQTFSLVGGTVAIRFSPEGPTLIWANPADGYTVHSDPEDGGIEIEFKNGRLESKLTAWWDNGPHHEIDEDHGS